MKSLVLASTSVYRSAQIKKLGIPFTVKKPTYDEESEKNSLIDQRSSPITIAETLSRGKAHSVAATDQTTISGDQLVHFDGAILGKPHTFDTAFIHLKAMQGKTHELITAITVLDGSMVYHLNHVTQLKMKKLSDREITGYLLLDKPYDCAGSYKIENSGIALFDEIITDDFTAIQGIPMLWLTQTLKELRYEFFQH